MHRDRPGPICPTRKTSPAMVQVKPVDLSGISRSFLHVLRDASQNKVLHCMLLRMALS